MRFNLHRNPGKCLTLNTLQTPFGHIKWYVHRCQGLTLSILDLPHVPPKPQTTSFHSKDTIMLVANLLNSQYMLYKDLCDLLWANHLT